MFFLLVYARSRETMSAHQVPSRIAIQTTLLVLYLPQHISSLSSHESLPVQSAFSLGNRETPLCRADCGLHSIDNIAVDLLKDEESSPLLHTDSSADVPDFQRM